MRNLLGILTIALLAACAAPVETKRYLLTPSAAPVSAAAAPVIGLREIALPLYARRQEIASSAEDGAILASGDHLWADDLPRAATRLIARRLSAGGGEAYAEPWPAGAAPELIAAVDVDRFVGALGGDTIFAGVITITRPDGRGRPVRRPFDIRTSANGPGYHALTEAYSAALSALADEIGAMASGV